MPPDAVLPPRTDAAPSSRNALRGGVLAALSAPPAPVPGIASASGSAAPGETPPATGLGARLRAAGRRGLRATRPLAAPFLHRLQMRLRTAVDGSDLAARMAGIEHSLARLSERLDTGVAAPGRAGEIGRLVAESAHRLDAIQQEVAEVTWTSAGNARRLDAARNALALVQDSQESVRTRLDRLERAGQRGVIPAGDDYIVRTPDGHLLVPAEDLPFLVYLSENGVPEPGTRRVLERLLRPGGTFLDVGANVGTMTLFGARTMGQAGRVYAVEPTPRIAALLRRSLAMNGMSGRVAVHACAAGEASGEAVLHLKEVMSHNSLLPPTEPEPDQVLTVPVSPVDEIVPPGTALDVAKIDVEGSELQVVRGMRRVMGESPALAMVVELNTSQLPRIGMTLESWLDAVEAPGFASYVISEDTGTCRPARSAPLAGAESANLLLLRPGADAQHPGLIVA